MKKVLSIIAMATLAVLFCGCNKENAPATGSKSVTISASMPDDEITKTELNGTSLTWKEGDKIYLSAPNYPVTWAGLRFDIDNSLDGIRSIASFTTGGIVPSEWKEVTIVVPYYGIKAESENNYRDGGWYPVYGREVGGTPTNILFYTNPCVQEYYNAKGPNGNYLAMTSDVVYKYKQGIVQFKNLMSIIKIPVSSSRERILSSIEVKRSREPISGTFWAWEHQTGKLGLFNRLTFVPAPENESMQQTIDPDTYKGTYGNWVKLVNINVTLTDSAQYFYLVVFPGSNPGTLDFTLTDRDGNTKIVTWNNPINMESGKIYNFPSIVWE